MTETVEPTFPEIDPTIITGACEAVSEAAEPTMALRWRGHTLEQNWLIRRGDSYRSEWRPVPEVTS